MWNVTDWCRGWKGLAAADDIVRTRGFPCCVVGGDGILSAVVTEPIEVLMGPFQELT